MKEFTSHIEFYSDYRHCGFSSLVTEYEWGNKSLAEAYMDKYWLSNNEFTNECKAILTHIFRKDACLPKLVFQEDYSLLASRGGCLFMQEDFENLQRAVLEVCDPYIYVIQSRQDFTEGEPMFRMRFPSDISWKELISGNYLSAVLLEMPYNEYYVFGASGIWGKYAANDYEKPLDIIGFKQEVDSIFKKHLMPSLEDQDELREWLPPIYRDRNIY